MFWNPMMNTINHRNGTTLLNCTTHKFTGKRLLVQSNKCTTWTPLISPPLHLTVTNRRVALTLILYMHFMVNSCSIFYIFLSFMRIPTFKIEHYILQLTYGWPREFERHGQMHYGLWWTVYIHIVRIDVTDYKDKWQWIVQTLLTFGPFALLSFLTCTPVYCLKYVHL